MEEALAGSLGFIFDLPFPASFTELFISQGPAFNKWSSPLISTNELPLPSSPMIPTSSPSTPALESERSVACDHLLGCLNLRCWRLTLLLYAFTVSSNPFPPLFSLIFICGDYSPFFTAQPPPFLQVDNQSKEVFGTLESFNPVERGAKFCPRGPFS